METQLKAFYGRRTTPGVKVLMLVLVAFLGFCLVFGKAGKDERSHAPVNTSVDIQSNQMIL